MIPEPQSCIQAAGSQQQGPAERRTCLLTGWFPGCQAAAVSWSSATKYRQRKALTACPWVGSMPIWDFPTTQAVPEGSGTQSSLVLWKVTVCLWMFTESLGTAFFLLKKLVLEVVSNYTSSESCYSKHSERCPVKHIHCKCSNSLCKAIKGQ